MFVATAYAAIGVPHMERIVAILEREHWMAQLYRAELRNSPVVFQRSIEGVVRSD